MASGASCEARYRGLPAQPRSAQRDRLLVASGLHDPELQWRLPRVSDDGRRQRRGALPHESTLVHSEVDPATIATIPNPNALTADDAAKLALAAVPDARLHSVQLPPGTDGTYMVTLMPHYSSEGAPQISAFVGPGAEVSAVVDPRQDPMGSRVLDWMKALHFGLGLGIVWKVLVFLVRVPAAAVRDHGLAHVADPACPEARRSRGFGARLRSSRLTS